MIELAKMDSLAFDPKTLKATAGGGAKNQTLYDNLPGLGVSVTHGRCASVGVGGLVLGGGIGFNMRMHGLLIDQLLETEIITAKGEKLICNKDTNKSLFWACRGGGGGNFGINTSFTFQTFPVDQVTVFSLAWTSNLDELLKVALDLLPGMPNEFGCKLAVVNSAKSGLSITLLGQIVGSKAPLTKLLDELSRCSKPSEEVVKPMAYWGCADPFSWRRRPPRVLA